MCSKKNFVGKKGENSKHFPWKKTWVNFLFLYIVNNNENGMCGDIQGKFYSNHATLLALIDLFIPQIINFVSLHKLQIVSY